MKKNISQIVEIRLSTEEIEKILREYLQTTEDVIASEIQDANLMHENTLNSPDDLEFVFVYCKNVT
jgi:hypothetical protein